MEFITDLLSSYGYYGIFLFLVIGCFGPPIPDEILLMVIGYLSFEGTFEFFFSLPVVITGSLAGIILDYLVGRFCLYSVRLVKMQSSRGLALKMRRAQDLVKRFGPGIVVGSYFLPGLRHWVPVMAGLLKAPPGPFGCGAVIGAILWSTAYLALGYLLAKNGVTLPASLGHSPYLAIPGVALIILAVWLTRRKLAGEKPGEVSTRI
jgi:membrane protein DedA with SNARE-associated domain